MPDLKLTHQGCNIYFALADGNCDAFVIVVGSDVSIFREAYAPPRMNLWLKVFLRLVKKPLLFVFEAFLAGRCLPDCMKVLLHRSLNRQVGP